MSGVGLEVLLEGLVPEIAYSGEKGVSITTLLKIVRQYHNSLNVQESTPQQNENGDSQAQGDAQDASIESSFSDAEMTSARWAWDWLRTRPQILINGNKRWNKLQLSEVLALPEAPEPGPATDTPSKSEKTQQKPTKSLTVRPRIHPSEDLVWQTLTRHGVDYKRVPVLEWKCLLGIASVRGEGILQSDLRKLVDQDKRSLPKRTDSLARKGYIAKRTIVVSRMKTSKLWLIDFAPPILENETGGLDLTPETLTKDLDPVPWHTRWTGDNIDMEAFGRTFVGITKAWGVIRYSDLRFKMGVTGKPWQMKTLAKASQRVVDWGILKYTAAAFPGSRKVFKDCLKFIRDPRPEEWDKFLATGKKTSQYSDNTRHREPKPNALAVYGKSGEAKEKGSSRQKSPRIFPGWTPEKPVTQNVFEVIKSAGPEGASNPQVSVATVGYVFRRYMSSYLTKVAEMKQPPHLKKFEITSRLVRTGKTSAYMFSAPFADGAQESAASQTGDAAEQLDPNDTAKPTQDGNPFGFGEVRLSAFAEPGVSLSELNRIAGKPAPRRKFHNATKIRMETIQRQESLDETAPEPTVDAQGTGEPVAEEPTPRRLQRRAPKRHIIEEDEDEDVDGGNADEATVPIEANNGADEALVAEPTIQETPQVEEPAVVRTPGAYRGIPGSLNPYPRRGRKPASIVITIYSEKLKDPELLGLPRPTEHIETGSNQQEDVEMKTAEEPFVGARFAAINVQTPPPKETPKEEEGEHEFAPERSTPTRGRGRGRGGRGRGGATRGRGVRKGQAYPGGPFKCELCGNTWKNDIGLKYHQTKALVPCNPNFDPDSMIQSSRKRRRMSPVEWAPSVSAAGSIASDNGDDEDGEPLTGRRRTTTNSATANGARIGASAAREKSSRPTVRNAVRWVKDLTKTFRGVASVDVDEPMDDIPPWDPPLRPRRQDLAAVSPPADAPESSQQKGLNNHKESTSKSGQAQQAAVQLGSSRHIETLKLPPKPTDITPSIEDKVAGVPGPGVLDLDSVRPPVHPEHLREPTEQDSDLGVDTGRAPDQDAITKPFEPLSNYDQMATEAKRKTAQAYDIINYLLDNNCGVFPGDKALFFAMIKVFLKEFRGQIPPTWKNCHAAIKALETRGLARVHTHMLRTETGKLATLSLVMRVGVDPMGVVPNFMKKQMKDTYPTLYIPPTYSPTKEELDFLQELDGKPPLPPSRTANKPNANGEKFRSRRRIDEVEVFNAPYYTQTANENAPEYKDPFWDRGKKRDADDDFEEPAEKRLRGDGGYDGWDGENAGGNSDSRLEERDGSQQADVQNQNDKVDISVPFGAKRRRYIKRDSTVQQRKPKANPPSQSMTPGTNLWKSGSPTVLEAIKVYGLLPARPKRGRPRIHPGVKKMNKIAPHIGRIRNPGLDSLPTSFFTKPVGNPLKTGKDGSGPSGARDDVELQKWPWVNRTQSRFKVDDSLEDKEYGKFCDYVHRCEDWELSAAGTAELADTDTERAPGKSNINFTPPVHKCNMRSVNLKWSEDRNFLLETLPYQDLDEIAGDDDYIPPNDDNDDNPQPEPRPIRRRRVGTIPSRRTGVGGRPTKFKLQAIKTGRELTAYPTSVGDFLRVPDDENEELDWTSENVKLTAFICVSTLLGGVDRVVDWGLMMRLFPDMTISQLRHCWCALKKDRQSTIASLTDKFRSSFLKAYAAGELPPIDFDNVSAYDWKSLIKWTTSLDGAERVTLPVSRKTLEDGFALPNCKFENREWRESYYHPQRSVFNKFQDACSEPMSFPADTEDRNSSGKSTAEQNLAVAMAWTRSLCVTPVDMYPTDRILRKRYTLLPGMSRSEITAVIIQGIDQLQREGIISKSTAKWSNGRRWRFNNRVPETLDKYCHEDKLNQAVAFKDELDEAFRPAYGGEDITQKSKRVTYVTKDGMMMTLLNLQALGRIRLETTGQPNVPMGHEPGNYETRKYTKRYLHFRIDIFPTEKYLFNEDREIATLRRRLEEAYPPTRGPGGATPAWCDVFEKVDWPRWRKYLSMVLSMIAGRGAMPADELAKTLKPVVMLFEVELILEWGRKLGILAPQLETETGGSRGGEDGKVGTALAAMEWWWFAVDGQKRRGLAEGLGQGRLAVVAEEEEQEMENQVVSGGRKGVIGGKKAKARAGASEPIPQEILAPIPRVRKPLPSGRRNIVAGLGQS